MGNTVEASRWFRGVFGEDWEQVMRAIAEAVREAQQCAVEAKSASELETNEAYAVFWRIVRSKLVQHLSFLPGCEIVSLPRTRGEFIVFQGALIYPFRMSGVSSDPDQIELHLSAIRLAMFQSVGQIHTPRDVQLALPLEDWQTDDIRAVEDIPLNANQIVCLPCDASADGGVQHIYIGEADVEKINEERGRLVWRHREELPLHLIHGESASLAGVDSYLGHFDDAPIPESDLSLRQPDQPAEHEIDPQPGTAMGEEQVGDA